MQELIRQKIKQIEQIQETSEKKLRGYRTHFRKLLLEIEYLGGWLALGYKSKYEFYEQELNANKQRIDKIFRQDSAKDYEILLGIPIGTYDYLSLKGLRDKFVLNNRYSTHYCSIDKAIAIKEKWTIILNRRFNYNWRLVFTKKNELSLLLIWINLMTVSSGFPTGDEIHKFSKTTLKKAVKGSGFYKNKKIKLEEELEVVQEKLELAKSQIANLEKRLAAQKEKNKELREELAAAQNFKIPDDKIPFYARSTIAALRAENEMLKTKLNSSSLVNSR